MYSMLIDYCYCFIILKGIRARASSQLKKIVPKNITSLRNTKREPNEPTNTEPKFNEFSKFI